MSPQYGELWPSSGWDRSGSLGTPANFNGFRVLAALLHSTLVVGVSQTAAFNRGRHLYSAGRPSHWALAHISSWIRILREACNTNNTNSRLILDILLFCPLTVLCLICGRCWLMKAGLMARAMCQSFTVDWWTLTPSLHSRHYVLIAMVSCLKWVSYCVEVVLPWPWLQNNANSHRRAMVVISCGW